MSVGLNTRDIVHFGETFRVEAETRAFPAFGKEEGSGTLTDPSSQAIKLFKPDGTQQGDTETSPTKPDADGQFTQEFTIPADGPIGEWVIEWTATTAGQNGVGTARVKVVA